MTVKDKIILDKLPKHIAIIMDGNGRWAKKQNKERIFGHQQGVNTVREITEASAELGIEYLTLYTFSVENWNRPQEEVDALMSMFVYNVEKETPNLMKNNIRLEFIGDIDALRTETKDALQKVVKETSSNSKMTMILALNYSSRWEITKMVKDIASQVEEKKLNLLNISQDVVSNNLSTKNYPDPDLLIRTSGEYRLSNYLLWQLAYSELYFTPVLWPDFTKENLYQAIIDYQLRERRFGKTSEQINKVR